MNRSHGIIGSVLLGLAVILGAFGAHWLEANYPARSVELFNTASFYQSIHGLGILILWAVGHYYRSEYFGLVVWCFLAGTIIFCGSLYALALIPAMSWLGMITPIGGLLFIVGWGMLVWKISRSSHEQSASA